MGLGIFLCSSTVAFSQNFNNNIIFGDKQTFGIGPRAIGMGGAFTAVADDATAAYWNPAGLAQISSYEFSLSSAPVYFYQQANSSSGFGFPWYASLQLVMPLAQENTLAISMFRPFHPQRDFFVGDITHTSAQLEESSYLINPSFQENEVLLSYAARFSAVKDFSIGLNVKRITNDDYYIQYFGSDPNIAAALSSAVQVSGFAVDLGILYRIPITKYSEEFRVGLDLNDMVDLASFSSGVSFVSQAGVTFNTTPGLSIQGIPLITLGFAYKNHSLFKIRNITAFDFAQISDSRYPSDKNKILHFGTEFWFFNDVLGIRTGYSTPLYEPGTISLGLSIRALNGDFELDGAFLQPVETSATVASGSVIGNVSTGGYAFEQFYLGSSFRFGGSEELPPPKVSAFVKPGSFSPSSGEKAAFYLDTTEDVTVNRWSVLIYDENNHLVRGMRGKGSPPAKLLWSGEDDAYQPLPPGLYTWAFQVQDNLDHVGSTTVQTVEIMGPAESSPVKDPTKLTAILNAQKQTLLQERQRLTQLAQEDLKKLMGIPESTPTTTTANAVASPPESYGNTVVADAGNVLPINFNNINRDSELSAHFDKNEKGEPTVAVSYRSNLTYLPYLYQEAAEVIKTTVNSVGTGLKDITTRVYYGKNELLFYTPSQAAANYAVGRINQQQLLQSSDVSLNGQKVGPNGY